MLYVDDMAHLAMIPPSDYPRTRTDETPAHNERLCARCDEPIPAPVGGRKYCSDECSEAARLQMGKGGGGRAVHAVVVNALRHCPFASGAIHMPDGGRVPDDMWGF